MSIILGTFNNHYGAALPRIGLNLLAVAIFSWFLSAESRADEIRSGVPIGKFMTNFVNEPKLGTTLPEQSIPDPHIDYQIALAAELFLVQVPQDYRKDSRYGLIVYVDPGNSVDTMPSGWQTILQRRRLLFIAPQKAGNDESTPRRLGLAVLAAREMMTLYNIDPRRVYAAGWSGGARIASLLGFYQADVFRATIQSCGSDFYMPVEHINGLVSKQQGADTYGLTDATKDEIARARQVKFVLITGSGDFRHGDVLDIYHGGFAQMGLQAKLLDVPGMAHENAASAALDEALDFIEAR